MDPRTATSGGGRHVRSHRRPPAAVRRPGLYLGVATVGAVMVNVLLGTNPAAQADAGAPESVSVAQQLGVTARSRPVDVTEDLQPLEVLAVSRSTREAAQDAAQQAQAAADQAALERRQAEAAAAAQAQAEAAAAAAGQQQADKAAAAPGTVARITNSAGSVKPAAQAAANVLASNVPGVDGITIGGTRASAADPHGHPSGLALDYMVGSNAGLGDAIVEYHRAHWDELGVEYIIWQQRMLSSPDGSWKQMADRGDATANHMDHPHVNYRG
jgi:hypothetical protein